MPRSVETIAVVGAGAGGLCAAKHMLGLGHDVTIFEMGSHIGGLWVYQNDNGRSPAYRSLHINSEARDTGYRDFPFPDSAGLFPAHWAVHAYLEAYADRFDLGPRVRFNSTVTSIAPAGDSTSQRWRIELSDGSRHSFDRVIVANGHQAEGMHPPFACDFTGEYLHSVDYEAPERFQDKNVLVVGTGNSGLDIAADVCTVSRSTTIAARSPVLIMPRMLFGAPLSRFLGRVERPRVPWLVRRKVRELITLTVHGRMEDFGFSTPKTRTHPASHPSLFAHIAWNRIRVQNGISEIRGNEVRFENGHVETYDALIAATGYEIDLPFLAPDLNPVDGHKISLYRRIVHPTQPGLYFIGMFDVSGGANIRMMDIQSRWLAAVVDDRVRLPSVDKMTLDIIAEHERIARLYPDRPRYGLELDPREYGLAIRADLHAGTDAVAKDGRRLRRKAVSRPHRTTTSPIGQTSPHQQPGS